MNTATFRSLLADDEGATLVEYSLVVALISVACIVAITYLGGKVKSIFSTIGNSVSGA
jgi:pilus assembly protein Flp/PilA